MEKGKIGYLGFIVSLAIFASLFLPWWSIRAPGVSIDVYPYGVKAWKVPSYDADWVVDRLLTLDGTLLIVGLTVLFSGVLALVGSFKFPPLLIAPAVLNLASGLLFYQLMRSALGKLALWYESGTNLMPIPGEPWGFVWGIGLCLLAGFVAPIPLILSYLTKLRQSRGVYPKNELKHGCEVIMKRKSWLTFGFLVVLMLIGISYVALIGITPTDTKIIDLLNGNKQNLLNVVGVVGAGIARDENNRIIGIAVYVDDDVINAQQVPSKLGEFTVLLKDIGEASDFERERMIIRNAYYHLLKVTTDQTLYQQNNNATIIIKNDSNETFAFGNSVYDLYFERWNGASWEFYTGVIGMEVITYLNPGEMGEVKHRFRGQTDKPFPSGKYRVISTGWLDQNGQTITVWGYAEFTVE